MENRNMLFGIIGLLVLMVIGLGIDRSNQFATLTEQIEVGETAVADAQAENETLSADLEALEEANAEELAALSTQMAVSSTEFESQISEISSASDVLADNNEAFATEAADLSIQIADLSEQRDTLQSDLDTASTNADELQTALDDSANVVATLEAEKQALEAQVEAMMPEPTLVPEPTVAVDTSAPDSSDLEFVFVLELDNTAIVQISPDNESIAILQSDNTIKIVSAVDGTQQLILDGFDGDLSDFIYSADGRSIAAIANNNTLIVFSASTGTISYEQEYDNPITGYDLSPDGNAIAVGTRNRLEIKVFDGIEQSRPDGVTSLDWSDDGSQIVITNGRSVSLLGIEDYTIASTTDLDDGGAQVVHAAISPDGSHIVGTTVDSELIVWSVDSAEIVWQTSIDATAINDVAWSSESAYVALVAEADISIYGTDGAWVAQATIDSATAVDWSSDGTFLVFATADQVSVVEAATLIE
jgi:WD40 repeat protein